MTRISVDCLMTTFMPSESAQVETEVAVLSVGVAFYSFYISTLLDSLRVLVYAHGNWTPPRLINGSLLSLTLAFWAMSSLYISLSFRRCIIGITISLEDQPGHSTADLLWSNTLMVRSDYFA